MPPKLWNSFRVSVRIVVRVSPVQRTFPALFLGGFPASPRNILRLLSHLRSLRESSRKFLVDLDPDARVETPGVLRLRCVVVEYLNPQSYARREMSLP